MQTKYNFSPGDPIRERIEELKRQIRDVTGEQPLFGATPECPPEVEEAFLERVLAVHSPGRQQLGPALREAGVSLPHPDELDDARLPARLWLLIGELAARSVVLEFTDHLSDRHLYTFLWRWLFEETTLLIPPPGNILHLDLVGSRTREDIQTYLRYYADAETRRQYARDFPDAPLPEHVTPGFKRDHLLPGHEGREPA